MFAMRCCRSRQLSLRPGGSGHVSALGCVIAMAGHGNPRVMVRTFVARRFKQRYQTGLPVRIAQTSSVQIFQGAFDTEVSDSVRPIRSGRDDGGRQRDSA